MRPKTGPRRNDRRKEAEYLLTQGKTLEEMKEALGYASINSLSASLAAWGLKTPMQLGRRKRRFKSPQEVLKRILKLRAQQFNP